MAIKIRSIPILKEQSALKFVARAKAKKRGTIDFSKQVETLNIILMKAKMK